MISAPAPASADVYPILLQRRAICITAACNTFYFEVAILTKKPSII